jgi:hypothetical protein
VSGLQTAAVCGATTPCDALAHAPQESGAAVGDRDGAAATGVAAGAIAPADDDETTPRRK